MPEYTQIFVYGTLMKGESNHYLLGNSEFMFKAKTLPENTLYSCGGFPGLVKNGHTAIGGEVYNVDKNILKDMDVLEGHPNHFERRPIKLSSGEIVQAYFLHERFIELQTLKIIESGNWVNSD